MVSYYNTGSGHGFYSSSGSAKSGGAPYSTHYNYNAGTSSSKPK